MLLQNLKLTNLLSFGPESPAVELGPLNVLIGPNGSGKSNFLDALALLKAAPTDLTVPIRTGGAVDAWLWKGGARPVTAQAETVLAATPDRPPIRYRLAFTEAGQRFEVVDEQIDNPESGLEPGEFNTYFRYDERGVPWLNTRAEGGPRLRAIDIKGLNPQQSILSQHKAPDLYPQLTLLGEQFADIRLYREFCFGRASAPRLPQRPDLPNDSLAEDGYNLSLVLNRLVRDAAVKRRLLDLLQQLFEGIHDIGTSLDAGTAQVYLVEANGTIPATRLSDGTLRYLCLLAILCHPQPPPLVCIEEPELGLHPDLLPSIVDLLREASQRMQLVVTTHSDVIVDALHDTPETVLVCEKDEGGSKLRRLDRVDLAVWLERYRLGELWRRGHIGGNRW